MKKENKSKVLSNKRIIGMSGNGMVAADVEIRERPGYETEVEGEKHEVGPTKFASLILTVDHFGSRATVRIPLEQTFTAMLIELLSEAGSAVGDRNTLFYNPELHDLTQPGEPQIEHHLAPLKKVETDES